MGKPQLTGVSSLLTLCENIRSNSDWKVQVPQKRSHVAQTALEFTMHLPPAPRMLSVNYIYSLCVYLCALGWGVGGGVYTTGLVWKPEENL